MSHTVLLTGATGFVGQHLLRALHARGLRVKAVVRADKADWPSLAACEVVRTSDVFAHSAQWWQEVCAGVDTVIHAAWYAQPGHYLQSPLNLNCLQGTLNLGQGAAQAGVRRWVGIGTCFEYDLRTPWLSVDTPLHPLTPYAASKAAAYLALSQCLPALNVSFAWCRLFYLYGEGEDPRRLVPAIHAALSRGEPVALTRGQQVRDFLDVKEAARQIVDAAVGNLQGAINICSGVPITVRELAEQIADTYGRRDLLHFGARPDNLVDPPHVVGVRAA